MLSITLNQRLTIVLRRTLRIVNPLRESVEASRAYFRYSFEPFHDLEIQWNSVVTKKLLLLFWFTVITVLAGLESFVLTEFECNESTKRKKSLEPLQSLNLNCNRNSTFYWCKFVSYGVLKFFWMNEGRTEIW